MHFVIKNILRLPLTLFYTTSGFSSALSDSKYVSQIYSKYFPRYISICLKLLLHFNLFEIEKTWITLRKMTKRQDKTLFLLLEAWRRKARGMGQQAVTWTCVIDFKCTALEPLQEVRSTVYGLIQEPFGRLEVNYGSRENQETWPWAMTHITNSSVGEMPGESSQLNLLSANIIQHSPKANHGTTFFLKGWRSFSFTLTPF